MADPFGNGETVDGRNGATELAAAVFAAIPDPMIAVDENDRVAAFNASAAILLERLAVGDPLARHVRAPDVLGAIGRARAENQSATASWSERAPVERVFEVIATPLHLDGRLLVALHLRETSARRRFERMRVEFVANASHELRTPLASLIGFIETLQGSARHDEAARDRFLDIMREQAQRMARLIDDLLSLSRIEQHLHLQPRERVDVALVMRQVADTLTPMARDSGVTLVFELDDAPILVLGDRDELLRVAENLVENAIKYGVGAGSEKKVVIGATKVRNEAVISVRDFGEGIASFHLPRLTERFYRVDAGQSRAKGGTGLGLAIVKHVVARHRGRLRIASEPGHGSTFQVSLPLHAAPDGRRPS